MVYYGQPSISCINNSNTRKTKSVLSKGKIDLSLKLGGISENLCLNFWTKAVIDIDKGTMILENG